MFHKPLKFLLFLLVAPALFFLLSSSVSAITLIQTAKNTSATTTVSATWNSATTAGNFLVAVISAGDPGVPNFTAPAGWTEAVTKIGLSMRTSIYYKENAASQTSTGNFSADVNTLGMSLIVAEYSGIATSSSLDQIASNASSPSSNTPSTGTTSTTSQANELLVGGLGAAANITYSGATNSFAIEDSQGANSNSNALLDRIVSATGTYGAGATQSASSTWTAGIATFKAAIPPTSSISGTVFSDEGSTAMGSGRTVAVSINGAAAAGSATTSGNGTYTISGLTMNVGDVLTIYLDNNTEKGVTVTVGNGSSLTGIDIYQNDLITRCDNACSLTNASLGAAANNGDSDISSIYNIASGALTIASLKSLFIPSSYTFAPGGDVNLGGNFTNNGAYTQGTSMISVTDTSSANKTFNGGGKTYYNFSISGGGAGAVILQGSNTFNDFTIGAPKTVTFTASTTQTINGAFSATGSPGNIITINSSSNGTSATVSKSSGTVSCDYLSLRDSSATGGAVFNAGNNSVNVSGNSGWVFNQIGQTGITVNKTAIGADGAFSFTVTGNGYSNFSITTAGGSGSNTQTNLAPGAYTAVESLPSGWKKTSDTCGSIIVSAGQITTCSVINSISNPVPSIADISPASKQVGSQGFTLTVNGTNFIPASIVKFNASDRPTTYASPAQLTAQIPSSDLTIAGTFTITVFNPSPDGGASNAKTFSVMSNLSNPIPSIQNITPSSKKVGSQGFAITVNGDNFISSSVVKFSGSDRPTQFVSATKLTAQIPASDLVVAGTFSVTVFNPAPDGGASNAKTFSVTKTNPIPSIANITPASKQVGSQGFTLTVNGTNFIPASIVKFNASDRPTTYASPAQLTAQIPSSDLTIAGTFTITVFNPSPDGGASNAKTFSVAKINPVPNPNPNPNPIPNPVPPVINTDNLPKGRLSIVSNATGGDETFKYTVNGVVSLEYEISTFHGAGSNTIEGVDSGITYAITETVPPGWKFNSVACDKPYTLMQNGITDLVVANGQTTTCAFNNAKPLSVQLVVETPITQLKKIIEKPAVSVATKVVSTVGVASSAVPAVASIIASSYSFSEMPLLLMRLLGAVLTPFGIKKRIIPWGVAYDAVTKQPLDPAYIELKNLQGKQVASSITDIDGRYGFLAAAGVYQLSARKTNYDFPSAKLTGRMEDEIYNNLYFGEQIEVNSKGMVISKNIPLDPVKFDWNEFAKKNKTFMKFYSRFDFIMRKVSDLFFAVGFAFSLTVFFFAPYPYNTIILLVYLVLLLLRLLGLKPKSFGNVVEKATGIPLSFSVLRIMIASSNTEIGQRVADAYGRYYCLVPKGKYYVKIEKKNSDGSYSLAYTSSIIDASKRGIISKKFQV